MRKKKPNWALRILSILFLVMVLFYIVLPVAVLMYMKFVFH